MKPGIYLIEVKECPCPKHAQTLNGDGWIMCGLCNSTGYTETRVSAEEWLLSMLGRVVWDDGDWDSNRRCRLRQVRFESDEK